MRQTYIYNVVIEGMNHVPLRTTKQGVIDLLAAFNKKSKTAEAVLKAIRPGIPFKNEFLSISKIGVKKKKPAIRAYKW